MPRASFSPAFPSNVFFPRQNLRLPGWLSSLMFWGCHIATSAYLWLRSEAGPRSNLASPAVADMSAITPTTCLCIMEMGARRSSTSLHCLPGSPPACWEKPCKSSSRRCWRQEREPRSQAWSPEISTSVVPALGKQLKGSSFRENQTAQACMGSSAEL